MKCELPIGQNVIKSSSRVKLYLNYNQQKKEYCKEKNRQ